MTTRINILFSTTRQWNPGDEFILFGIINVLRSISDDFNPVIFNRNPEIQRCDSKFSLHCQMDFSRFRFKRLKTGAYDNSFKDSFLDKKFIDLAIFAGTPEWGSPRLKAMYEYIDKHSIPVAYLGIGLGSDRFDLEGLPPTYKKVLRRASLITVRDAFSEKAFSAFKPLLLPCPSLFAAGAELEKKIDRVRKVGLIFGSPRSIKNNRISPRTFDFMKGFYDRLLEKYSQTLEFEFIAHYIDELVDFYEVFPSRVCHYSYDAKDYPRIYNRFDLVAGTRVHGIGLSASMGIPGIPVKHDARGETTSGFLAEALTAQSGTDEAMALFDKVRDGAAVINQKLLAHKRETFMRYQGLLKKLLKETGFLNEK